MKRGLFKILLFIFLGFWLLQTGSPRALAQRVTPQKIQELVNQLDERLQTLDDLARQYPNRDLKNTIQKLKNTRQSALQLAKSGKLQSAQRELKMAIQLSDVVLKRALTTIRNSLQGEMDGQIQQAEVLLHQHYNADADRLLKSAKRLRGKAKRAFENGDFAKASSYLKAERKALEACLKLLSKDSPENLGAFQTERQNFFELKKQAQELLRHSKMSLGISLYNQALDQARKGDQEFKKGHTEQATRFYQWATRLMLRTIDLLQGHNLAAAEQAREALSLAEQVLQTTQREFVSGSYSVDELQKKVVLQAQKLISRAQHDFEAKNYHLAIQEADVARKLLSQINRTMAPQNADYKTILAENMADLEQNLRQLKSPSEFSSTTRTLFQMARRFLNTSKQELALGHFQKSAADFLVANKITIQLEKLLEEKNLGEIQSDGDVESAYRDLKGRLSEVNVSHLNDTQRAYYDLLQGLLKKIGDFIQAGEIKQASQLLRVAQTAWQKIQ